MGVPATTGRLCKTLAEMEIGDYIRCTYTADTANTAGEFSDLGGFVDTYTAVETVTDENGNQTQVEVEKTYEELPLIPIDKPIGYFYYLKAAKGMLIADRMVQAYINFSALNSADYVYGRKLDQKSHIRILSPDECKLLVGSNTLNGNALENDDNVWHGRYDTTGYYRQNLSVINAMGGNGNSYTRYGNGAVLYLEVSNQKKLDSNKTIFDLKGETYNDTYHSYGYWANAWTGHSTQTPIWIGDLVTNGTGIHDDSRLVTYYVLCFRPAIEYVDNPKSKTFWY